MRPRTPRSTHFLSALNTQETANPTIATVSVDDAGGTTSTKQEGYSMESRDELGKSTVRDAPDAAAEQIGVHMGGWLWNALSQAQAPAGKGVL